MAGRDSHWRLEIGLGEGCDGRRLWVSQETISGLLLVCRFEMHAEIHPVPRNFGPAIPALSQLFFHVSKSGCSLGAERHRLESTFPPNQVANVKNWPVNQRQSTCFTRYRKINALLLTAATLGALSPSVPPWGHKSRRDGYAYTPWGKLDITPCMYILCRQSRHVTANQSFPTRKLPDTQPERQQQPWKRQRETLVLPEKGRSLPASSAVGTGRGSAKMWCWRRPRRCEPSVQLSHRSLLKRRAIKAIAWLARWPSTWTIPRNPALGTGYSCPKPKKGQLAQHSGGTHLLNPEPSTNLTGPFSVTRTSMSR